MKFYKQLENSFRQLSHLNHLGAICNWDEATMMPVGGAKCALKQWLNYDHYSIKF